MNNGYLKKALKILGNKNLLINLASKRATQIARGEKIYVKCGPNELPIDIALLEIIEGKISWEKAKES